MKGQMGLGLEYFRVMGSVVFGEVYVYVKSSCNSF